MPERQKFNFTWENGYFPSTAQVTGVPNCLLGGRNLWARGKGLMAIAKGFGSAVAQSGGSVNPLLNTANTYAGLTGGGSITQAFGVGIYFFAGAGQAFVGGISVGSVLGGTVTIRVGSSTVQAGLAPPGTPAIADSGAAGHNNGLYSVGVTARRILTGGESSVSPPSSPISVSNHGIKITALPGMPSGADSVGIYVTKQNFGDIGPLFHFYDESLSVVNAGIAGGGYVIKLPTDLTPGWIDLQLGDLAPLDFSIPPTCTHVFSTNAVVVAAGCYGGAGLSPSFPNKPEAYPVRFVAFIPGGGTITAVKGSGLEGRVLVGTASSLNLVSASQSTISPLNIDPIWPTTGVNSANQIAAITGEIYAWIGRPIRDSLNASSDPGDEASSFAAPVFKFFQVNGYAGSTNVVVCYDPDNDAVWYVNGSVGIAYVRWLGQWTTPMDMPATITTAVTDNVNRRALFSDAVGNLYQPETGLGTNWSLVTQMQGGCFIKSLIGGRGMVDRTLPSSIQDIYTDLNIATPDAAGTGFTLTAGHGTWQDLGWLQDVESVAIGMRGFASGGQELYGYEMLYNEHPVRVP